MKDTVEISKELIQTIDLKNGQELQIIDNSRVLMGDRWFISILARVDIDVKRALADFESADSISPDQIHALLGDTVRFEKKMERNFIDKQEKDQVKQDMVDSLIESITPYLSNPLFSKRYVLKQYGREKQKQTWQMPNN